MSLRASGASTPTGDRARSSWTCAHGPPVAATGRHFGRLTVPNLLPVEPVPISLPPRSPGEPCAWVVTPASMPPVRSTATTWRGRVITAAAPTKGIAAATIHSAASPTPASAASAPARAQVPAPAASPGSVAGTRTAIHHGSGAATRAAAPACRVKARARTMSASPAQAVIRACASRTATAPHDHRCDGGVWALEAGA